MYMPVLVDVQHPAAVDLGDIPIRMVFQLSQLQDSINRITYQSVSIKQDLRNLQETI